MLQFGPLEQPYRSQVRLCFCHPDMCNNGVIYKVLVGTPALFLPLTLTELAILQLAFMDRISMRETSWNSG